MRGRGRSSGAPWRCAAWPTRRTRWRSCLWASSPRQQSERAACVCVCELCVCVSCAFVCWGGAKQDRAHTRVAASQRGSGARGPARRSCRGCAAASQRGTGAVGPEGQPEGQPGGQRASVGCRGMLGGVACVRVSKGCRARECCRGPRTHAPASKGHRASWVQTASQPEGHPEGVRGGGVSAAGAGRHGGCCGCCGGRRKRSGGPWGSLPRQQSGWAIGRVRVGMCVSACAGLRAACAFVRPVQRVMGSLGWAAPATSRPHGF
jgi:hypothetical protein